MKEQQFGDKAQKLYEKLSNITSQAKKQKFADTMNSSSVRPTTKYSQTISELIKFQHDLYSEQQSNCKKITQLNQQIRKYQAFVSQQNEHRIKMNENFIHSALKVENNMQNALGNVKKVYLQRQRKMQQKLEQIIHHEKNIIEQQFSDHKNIEQQINELNNGLRDMRQDLVQMKKNRLELQDKIYRQFSEQIKDLKSVFDKTNRERQERQSKILASLKKVYKRTMESLKNEEVNRQANEKMFLTIIEQLIDRISQA